MNPAALSRLTLTLLITLLFLGILTIWLPGFLAGGMFRSSVFLLALVWVLLVAIRPPPLHLAPAVFPLSAAVIWPLVQLAAGISVYRWDTWNAFWNWVAYWICFFLVLQVASDSDNLRRFLKALLYFSFGLSVVSLLQMFTSGGKIFWIFPSGYTDFVLGPFVYQNQYAAFVELTMPLALSLAFFSKTDRSVYAVMAAVMMGSVVASASRAGTFLVIAEVFAVPLVAWRMRLLPSRAGGMMMVRVLLFVVVSFLVVGTGTVWNRFNQSDPYFLRREVHKSAVRMLQDRPLMGFGLGTWTTAYPRYAIFDPGAVINQAHDDWMQWAVEGGTPFLAFMLAFAALLLRPAVCSIWGMGVPIVLVHCLVDYPLQQRPALAALFFAVAGAVTAQRGRSGRGSISQL